MNVILTCLLGARNRFPLRTHRIHQRNLRRDPLQLLVSRHQVVAVSRRHKSGSSQQSAVSSQQSDNTRPCPDLPHSSAPAHKTAIRPTTHTQALQTPPPAALQPLPSGRRHPIQKPVSTPIPPTNDPTPLKAPHPQNPQHHPKPQCPAGFQRYCSSTLRAPQRVVEAC